MEENNQITPEDQPEETPVEEAIEPATESRPEETSEISEMPPHPLVDGQTDLPPTPNPVEDAMEESEVKKETSKFQRFMRKVFLWLGVIVVSALVGFLGFYFAFYRPQGAELQTIQDQLVSAKSQIATQDAKYAELNSRLTALENAEFHSVLLDITTDIYAARLALSNEDVVAAKAALSNTAEKLASIQENLTAFDATVANSLSQRLGLIQSDLDHDTESAIADCDLMLNTLEDVETALFP